MKGFKKAKQSGVVSYTMRHLIPANLSPMKRSLRKQLAELKGVNARQSFNGPVQFREGSKPINSVLIVRERAVANS